MNNSPNRIPDNAQFIEAILCGADLNENLDNPDNQDLLDPNEL